MGSQCGMKHPFGELIERSSFTIAAQGQISIEDSLAITTVDKAANIRISCLSQPLAYPALCLARAGINKLQVPVWCSGSPCWISAKKSSHSGNAAWWQVMAVCWEVLDLIILIYRLTLGWFERWYLLLDQTAIAANCLKRRCKSTCVWRFSSSAGCLQGLQIGHCLYWFKHILSR